MMKRARLSAVRSSGFTMVELMLVVLIIGILSTIAVPELLNFSIRSQKTERDMAMRNIQNAVIDLLTQNDKFPQDLGGGQSQITCFDNPPGPYTGIKKQWLTGQPGWSSLSYEPIGFVYFHYYVYAYSSPSLTYIYVRAYSDLNGNGIPAYREVEITRDPAGSWSQTFDNELPVGES